MSYKKLRYPEEHDMIFGFLEEDDDSWVSSYESSIDTSGGSSSTMDEEEDDDENASNADEQKLFWKSKKDQLQAIIYRTTSFETKIRQATKDCLRELNLVGVNCCCKKTVGANSCRSCRQKEISKWLQNVGFDCVLCKSMWKSSSEIPAGEHIYLEVVQTSSGSKKLGKVKVIIELNFRSEFQMARASEEYNELINKLPEVFVGKIERLQNMIKILCSASKKCMQERKMHMPPWRKKKYMEAKWHGVPLPQVAQLPMEVEPPAQRPKPMASLLTFDLADNLPGGLNKAIKVI